MNNKQQKKPKNKINGWINLEKPFDMTSTEAVSIVKRILSPTKIGHAGTLDPLASGVLPLALGEATKTVQYLMNARKEYIFTVKFGEQTTTDDAEGEIIKSSDNRPEDNDIKALLPSYIGKVEQVPPIFSALKINGQRAYDLARAGENIEMQSRIVKINKFEMLRRLNIDEVEFKVLCGKGTYVRSLARDIGLQLNSCAHVSKLRRTKVGSFYDNDTISLDNLQKYASDIDNIFNILNPVESSLDDIPIVRLDNMQAQKLRHGHHCYISDIAIENNDYDGEVYQAWVSGDFFALVKRNARVITPLRIFNL